MYGKRLSRSEQFSRYGASADERFAIGTDAEVLLILQR
jgi:hypothetical protein